MKRDARSEKEEQEEVAFYPVPAPVNRREAMIGFVVCSPMNLSFAGILMTIPPPPGHGIASGHVRRKWHREFERPIKDLTSRSLLGLGSGVMTFMLVSPHARCC